MKKKMYLQRLIIYVILYFCLNSCIVSDKPKIEIYDRFRTQKLEYRDSIFIIYTIKQWVDSDGPGFKDYSQYWNLSHEQVLYSFDGVFYSPDKKKMIVWVIDKKPNATWRNEIDTVVFYYPPKKTLIYKGKDKEFDSLYKEHIRSIDTNNKECPGNALKDTIYGGAAVIGFRDDTNKLWNLYPLSLFGVECYSSKEAVISVLGQYYFKAMKNSLSMQVLIKNLDQNYGGKVRYDLNKYAEKMGLDLDTVYVIKEPGYNLQDKDFWDKNLIWQNGSILKGYYYFQLGGIKPLKMPKINYPDSILKLYR